MPSHLLNNFRPANSEIQNYSPDGPANNNCVCVNSQGPLKFMCPCRFLESLLAAAGDVHNFQPQCPHNVHKT